MNIDILDLDDGYVFQVRRLTEVTYMPYFYVALAGERRSNILVLRGTNDTDILCGTLYHPLTEFGAAQLSVPSHGFISISDSKYDNQWYINNERDLRVMMNELSLLLELEKVDA